MASIRVTPETLEAQGNDLKNYAQDLEGILQSIDSKMQEIDDGWDGLSQSAFTAMYQDLKKSLDEFPKVVDSLGDATVGAAQAFDGIDTELQNSFK